MSLSSLVAIKRAAKSQHLRLAAAALTVAAGSTVMAILSSSEEEDDKNTRRCRFETSSTSSTRSIGSSTSRTRMRGLGLELAAASHLGLGMGMGMEPSKAYCSAGNSNGDDSTTRSSSDTHATSPSDEKSTPRVLAPSVLAPTEAQPTTNTNTNTSNAIPTKFSLRRRATLRRMDQSSTKDASLLSKYELDPDPIGEGAFGQVFVGRDRSTGELVAVKKIWKEFSNNQDFVREMSTLLQIRSNGGHPHICSLRENFDETEHFALVLDLIKGGEMFDHLVANGAYSELDASRLIREVASALDFLHGIGLVHCDLKPENLMLSSKNDSASIKLVDFGSSENLPDFEHHYKHDPQFTPIPIPLKQQKMKSGGTVAYSPPEAFETSILGNPSRPPVATPLDMWSLGVILHIMLTGLHPFDPDGDATDEELAQRIKTLRKPPLDTPDTKHLSASAIDLLSKLLEPDPTKRLKVSDMLQHSWVKGETARADIMAGSDRRLSKFRKFKSRIEQKVFQHLISWSHDKGRRDPGQNGESLVEKAFKSLDKEKKGFLTMEDISKGKNEEEEEDDDDSDGEEGEEHNVMSLSAFSDLLGGNMQNKYLPRGHVVFSEGDIGEHMYFLNSGTCEVSTEDGFHAVLKHGDTFGEGGLLNANRKRSATIKTLTPIHAIQLDRECFTKYLLGSDSALALTIKERINKRKFGRAEFIFGNQDNLQSTRIPKGGKIFSEGDDPDAIYFLSEGTIDVQSNGNTVYFVQPGELLGVQSFYMNRPRGACAVCVSDHCWVKAMLHEDFAKLVEKIPELEESLRELALRREFRRAIVRKLKVSFDHLELQEVFNLIDLDKSGRLSRSEVKDLLSHLDFSIPETEVNRLLATLDLENTGFINFEEFSSIFA